jgi:hypothetical protein
VGQSEFQKVGIKVKGCSVGTLFHGGETIEFSLGYIVKGESIWVTLEKTWIRRIERGQKEGSKYLTIDLKQKPCSK